MPSPPTIDLDQLLAPLDGDNPCGESLRWEPIYDEIRHASREEDRDPLVDSEETSVNWPLVIELTTDCLANRSKDLQLAGWLTQALVERHGFAGLRDGLRLVNGLLDNFWDGLYPEIDEGDMEPRVAPLVWLTDADRGAMIPNRVREIPFNQPGPDKARASYNLWDARNIKGQGQDEDEEAYAHRVAIAEEKKREFEDAVANESPDYLRRVYEDLAECKQVLLEFDNRVDERFQEVAPGTTALRQALEDCDGLLRRILKQRGILTEGEEPGEEGEGDGEAAEGGAAVTSGTGSGPIRDRQEALRRLDEVAAYLRRTEPHSPVSYLIQRALSWSQMSLDQLLLELVEDETVRSRIDVTLGIRRSDGQEQSEY